MSDWKILRSDSLSKSVPSNSRKNAKIIKNTQKMSIKDLKEEGLALYEIKKTKEEKEKAAQEAITA